MAVITIAKIQVRRGRKHQGTGIPRLSSGEFGWALDAKELYIGNGSVSEGAPAIGNTRILTEHDLVGNDFVDPDGSGTPVFDLSGGYVYRSNDSISTSNDPASPTQRSVQERLDDWVVVDSFGASGDGFFDCTVAIQRAINELFIYHRDQQNLFVINFLPGEYLITDTINLPPYCSISGQGIGRTIIRQTYPGRPVLRTVSNGGDIPSSSDNQDTQNRFVNVSDITLVGVSDTSIVDMTNTRNIEFHKVGIVGEWERTDTGSDSSLLVDDSAGVLVSGYLSNGNLFDKCEFSNVYTGVKIQNESDGNVFSHCVFDNAGQGIHVTNNSSYNLIEKSSFFDINVHGVHVQSGHDNIVRDSNFNNVGNGANTDIYPMYSIILYDQFPNYSLNNKFSRIDALTIDNGETTLLPYPLPVKGTGFVDNVYTGQCEFPLDNNTGFLRLPYDINVSYQVEYRLDGIGYTGIRIGTLHVLVNSDGISLYDDYHFSGVPSKEDVIKFVSHIDSSSQVLYISIEGIDPDQDQTKATFKIKAIQA